MIRRYCISIMFIIVLPFMAYAIDYGGKYYYMNKVVLDKLNPMAVGNYGAVANSCNSVTFDDYRRIYYLKDNIITAKDKHGRFLHKIIVNLPAKQYKKRCRLKTTSDGSIFYLDCESQLFSIDKSGEVIGKDLEKLHKKRNEGLRADLDGNSFKVDLVSSEGKGDIKEVKLIKLDMHGIQEFTRDINRGDKIIGVDWDGNVYLVNKNVMDMVYLYTKDGYYAGNIPLAPLAIDPRKASRFERYKYGDMHGTAIRVARDGSVYQWNKFGQDNLNTPDRMITDEGELYINAYTPRCNKACYQGRFAFEFEYYLLDREVMTINDILESIVDMQKYARLLRNAIFARHGRIFKSKDLREIFEATDWYKPDPNYSDDRLNDIERKNVQFILDYEKKMGWKG